MVNPHSLVDSGFKLKASKPLKELSEQPSSDEEISFDPEEDWDFFCHVSSLEVLYNTFTYSEVL